MKTREGKEVLKFIRHNTSIQDFYDFVTHKGTDFSFNINNCRTDNFETPLIKALYINNMPLFHALLEMGADPNQSYTYYEHTPLHDAIEANNLTAIKDLVAHGAHLDVAVDTLNQNSLAFAQQHKNKEIIQFIYDNIPVTTKLRVNRANKVAYFNLAKDFCEAIKNDNRTVVAELLTKHCLNLNRLYYDFDHSHTRLASSLGHYEIVKLLARSYDDLIEPHQPSGSSTPQFAIQQGHWNIGAFLNKEQTRRYAILKNEATKQNAAINTVSVTATMASATETTTRTTSTEDKSTAALSRNA
jgi:hypothetical protein